MSKEEDRRSEIVLPSKLDVPLLPVGYYHRDGLMEKLQFVEQQRLTCVVSPIGYGKTSALTEFALAHERCDCTAWLSLDDDDNAPHRFWAHMFAALISHNASQWEWSSDDNIKDFAFWLHGQCESGQAQFLVIDNFDLIENPQVESEFLRFIALLPRDYHVVICARCLSRRMLSISQEHGQLLIDIDDLRFSVKEVQDLISQRSRLSEECEADRIADFIHSKTGGWPQGIALSLQARETCARRGREFAFSGSNGLVKRYFSSRVFPLIPGKLAALALELAPFERFCLDFCLQALQLELDAPTFAQFVQGGLVLAEPCDEDDVWYRFNNLFLDWLCSEAQNQSSETVRRNCLHASIWHAEKRNENEAAKYFLMASDFSYVESVVESTCGLVRPDRNQSAFAWLIQKKSEEFPSSPLLCALSAWAYNAGGRSGDAMVWIERFAHASREKGDLDAEVIEFAVEFMAAKCLAMKEDGRAALDVCENLLRSTRQLSPSLLSVVYQSMGEACERLGDCQQAEESYLQALAYAKVEGKKHHQLFNRMNYAEVRYIQGCLDDAMDSTERMLMACPEDSPFVNFAYALLAMIALDKTS